MNSLYLLLRFLAAFFGLTTLFGMLWAADSVSKLFIISGILMGFSSLAVAFVSPQKLLTYTTKRVLVMLCVIGVVTGLVLVTDDFNALFGIPWHIIIMRISHIAILATMAIIALKWSSKPKPT